MVPKSRGTKFRLKKIEGSYYDPATMAAFVLICGFPAIALGAEDTYTPLFVMLFCLMTILIRIFGFIVSTQAIRQTYVAIGLLWLIICDIYRRIWLIDYAWFSWIWPVAMILGLYMIYRGYSPNRWSTEKEDLNWLSAENWYMINPIPLSVLVVIQYIFNY